MKLKRIIAIACTAAMMVSLISGCGGASDKGQKEAVKEAEGTAKEDLPLAKYPETVTVHLGGKMNPNAKIPKGMSFEDNSYTRLLKENLNIQVVYDWTASTSDYDEKMSLCIGSNTIPEIMNVNATQYRALLKYDMIQPLDKYFDDYASDALKSYVKSGGEELQKCITNEDGELMAIPAPNLTAGGVNEMWIRQDWLDALAARRIGCSSTIQGAWGYESRSGTAGGTAGRIHRGAGGHRARCGCSVWVQQVHRAQGRFGAAGPGQPGAVGTGAGGVGPQQSRTASARRGCHPPKIP